MPRRFRSSFTALTAVAAALVISVAGCSAGDDAPSGPSLPDGATLLTDSAEAMRSLTSARFSVQVEGEDTGLPVRSAQGVLNNEGAAEGTASVTQFGQAVELEFTLVDETLYVKGPTGSYQELPAALAGSVYDPSVILDPDRGVANVLDSATGAVTEAAEAVDGVDAHRVRATFPGTALADLVPGLESDTEGQVWIAVDGNRLLQARFPVTGGSVLVTLSEFDVPVDVTAPN